MPNIAKFETVKNKILTIRNQKVILDSDVAELYGVETKRVNEAVRNNSDKFPEGYIFELSITEWHEVKSNLTNYCDIDYYSGLVEKIDQLGTRKHSTVAPKAFTEKGLYMLATILKSKKATETTLAIIETYANIKELGRTINQLTDASKEKQKSLMQKGSEIIGDILDDNMETTDTETTIELNFAMLKVKHTIKKKKK